jgi:cob(I)alamin adenosyltransferase
MGIMKKGYIHLYTGDGKGKTTAAFGIALRAHYAGFKVYVAQFVKSMAYHETKIQAVLNDFEIEQLGEGCFMDRSPNENDVFWAQRGWEKCKTILKSGDYDMIVLDELTIALYFGLLKIEEVLEGLSDRKENIEVVITGRYAPEILIKKADLVTEMREVKHYYQEGVVARDGIER